MKKITSYVALVLFGLMIVGVANVSAQKKMKKVPVMWAAEDIKWEEMKGGPPGAMVAMLWGDMAKGAYGALVKLPPNMKHALHTHSYDVKVVVISGTFTAGLEGGTEKTYGAGSYLMAPGGVKHTSGTGDAGATVFQEGPGKFDFQWITEKQ